jgi:hypothetical protein
VRASGEVLSGGGSADRPPRRSGNSAVIVAVVVLAVVGGYVVHHHRAGSAGDDSHPHQRQTSGGAPVTTTPGTPTLTTDGTCDQVQGRALQVGVEAENSGRLPLRIDSLAVTVPRRILLNAHTAFAACGQPPKSRLHSGSVIATDAKIWLRVSVVVAAAAHCPSELPILFRLPYSVNGQNETLIVAGPPDLGLVHLPGCHTATAL